MATVVSFPRTGTHLTMDFLRRNFREFAVNLLPWQSGERLYYSLDIRSDEEEALYGATASAGGRPRKDPDALVACKRPNFVVKTHDLPFAEAWMAPRLAAVTGGRHHTLIYPFRRMSRALVSYHAHQRSRPAAVLPAPIPEDPAAFLVGPDCFLGPEGTVADLMLRHARWGLDHAVPVDIEDLLRRPAAYVAGMARVFGWTPVARADPLPPKRITAGFAGELFERLRGRPSSEVRIAFPNRPASEVEFIDRGGPLAELYGKLREKAFDPAG